MSYETGKFSDNAVENPSAIFSKDKFYNVPYSQRNFSWSVDEGDTSETSKKNQIGKFWNALLRQWENYTKLSEDRNILKKEVETRKDHKTGADLTMDVIDAKKTTLETMKPKTLAEYFMGPMVFVPSTTVTAAPTEQRFEIVDGQQRLTTITMICAISRDLYFEFNEEADIFSGSINFSQKMISRLCAILEQDPDSTTYTSNGDWRFQPNQVDLDLFNKIILPWLPKQHLDNNQNQPSTFREDEPRALCLRLPEKIKYFESILADSEKKKTLRDSNLKIMQAYIDLHKKIWTGLLTNFTASTEQQETITNKINEEAEKITQSELHLNPNKYDLTPEFFNNDTGDDVDKFGFDIIQKQHWNAGESKFENITWTDDVREKITKKLADDELSMAEYEKKRKTRSLYFFNRISGPDNKYEKIYSNLQDKNITDLRIKKAKANLVGPNKSLDQFIENMLLEMLFGVRVTVDTTRTADRVFRTLNSLGQPLNTSDLIKSHLLSLVDKPEDKKIYADKWDKVIDSVSKKPDDFLTYSLRSRGVNVGTVSEPRWEFNKFKVADLISKVGVDSDTLFDILETKIRNEIDVKIFVAELEEDIKLYSILLDPSLLPKEDTSLYSRNEEIRPALMINKKLGYVYARAPIMTAWRHWGEKSGTTWKRDTRSFTVLVKFLVLWLFRYKTIRKMPPSSIETAMTKVCTYIQNSPNNTHVERQTVLQHIQKFLLQYDDAVDFYDKLKDYSLKKSGTDLDVTILSQITSALTPVTRELIGDTKLTREHVLPQDPELWDETDFVSHWSITPKSQKDGGGPDDVRMYNLIQFFGIDSIPTLPHDFESMVDKLGNLTLLIGHMNSALQKLQFKEKKFHYENIKDSELEKNGCGLKGNNTVTPPISACPHYSDKGVSQVDYTEDGVIIPKGTKTNCPQHDIADGYRASELSINKKTVMKIDDTADARHDWTVLSILERTQFLVSLTNRLWQLPKIYCTNPICPKYKEEIKSIKGELDPIDTEKFIENKKCEELINGGSKCDHSLVVLWYRKVGDIGIAPDLDVPEQFKPNANRIS